MKTTVFCVTFISLLLLSLTNLIFIFDFSEPIFIRLYGDDEGEDGGHQGEDGGHQGDHQGEDGGHNDHFRKFFNFRFFDRHNNDDTHKPDKKGDDNKVKVKEQDQAKIYKGYGIDPADGEGNNKKSFNFAAVGDFGCSKNAKKTVDNIKESKPELVLPLGDLSYQKNANCWFDIMSPLKDKLMVTLGFHDVNDGQEKMDQYFKSFDLNKPYYSFDYRKVHFIVMASESNFVQGSGQYEFVKQDLEQTSKNKDVDWIIITSYGPFYTSPTTHKSEKSLREVYHPLFDKYGVDLVLQAHNHNYQRTYPITYNPNDSSEPTIKNQTTSGYYDPTNGTIFAIIGTGGESFYALDGQAPYVATQFNKFGFLNIELDNGNPHTTLTGTFFDNKGNEIRDHFTTTKEIK